MEKHKFQTPLVVDYICTKCEKTHLVESNEYREFERWVDCPHCEEKECTHRDWNALAGTIQIPDSFNALKDGSGRQRFKRGLSKPPNGRKNYY